MALSAFPKGVPKRPRVDLFRGQIHPPSPFTITPSLGSRIIAVCYLRKQEGQTLCKLLFASGKFMVGLRAWEALPNV